MITIKTRKAVSRLKDTFRASLVSPSCIALLPPQSRARGGRVQLTFDQGNAVSVQLPRMLCYQPRASPSIFQKRLKLEEKKQKYHFQS